MISASVSLNRIFIVNQFLEGPMSMTGNNKFLIHLPEAEFIFNVWSSYWIGITFDMVSHFFLCKFKCNNLLFAMTTSWSKIIFYRKTDCNKMFPYQVFTYLVGIFRCNIKVTKCVAEWGKEKESLKSWKHEVFKKKPTNEVTPKLSFHRVRPG